MPWAVHLLLYALMMGLTWPFVGRAGELSLVSAAILDPDRSGIVISGAAGVGKSRIAREALEVAAAKGDEVRWVTGTACARGIPLGAMASWTRTIDDDHLLVVRGVIESLTAAAPGTRVMVGVDDAHLLDDLSIYVLHQIVSRNAAKLVLTVRDDAPIPEDIQKLWQGGQFARLDLRPMPVDETAALLSATLTGLLDPAVSDRLWQLTRGNVLYLRHIVEQEVAEGRLENQRGSWRWSGDPTLPSGLVDLLGTRIGALESHVVTVLDTLAVGEPVGLAALQCIAGVDAVEEADTLGLINLESSDTGAVVRLAHPLYGEVRRSSAPATKLRRLRGLVAGELATADDRDCVRPLVHRATLTLDSDLEPDGDLLIRAAQGAICLADLPLADRLAQAAARAGAGPGAQFIRAHALSWLGRGREADDALASIPVGELTADDQARLTYLRASNVLWALGDHVGARQIIDSAEQITAADSGGYHDALRAVYWFAADRPDEAVLASQGLVLDELPAIVGAETAWALTSIYADAGRTSEAEDLAAIGYAVATRCADAPQMRFNIADAHVESLVLSGRVGEADAVAGGVRQEAHDLSGAAQSLSIAISGCAALGAGRLDEACALLARATGALSAQGHAMGWGYRYCVPYATALAMRGLTEDAAAVLDGLDTLHRPFRSLKCERNLARAWVLAGQGALSEALAILRSAAEVAEKDGRYAAEVMCLQTAVQFGDHSCVARLGELEDLVEGPRVRRVTHLAKALRDGDPAQMALSSTAFEEIGDLIGAVDAAALAAIAYRRENLRGSAYASGERAEALALRCGGADTPMLRKARNPLPLTDREREIALLVAGGASNGQIGERLYLSERTVGNHIYKAMKKTGTASRDELAALVSQSSRSHR